MSGRSRSRVYEAIKNQELLARKDGRAPSSSAMSSSGGSDLCLASSRRSFNARRSIYKKRGPRAAARASICKTAPARAVRNRRCVRVFLPADVRKDVDNMPATDYRTN